MSSDLERDREDMLDYVEQADPCYAVVLRASIDRHPDYSDPDGYEITAMPETLFDDLSAAGCVQTTFAQGSDPRAVALALEKFAAMLRGPHGRVVANMSSCPGNVDDAHRGPDGTLDFSNIREVIRRAADERADDDDL